MPGAFSGDTGFLIIRIVIQELKRTFKVTGERKFKSGFKYFLCFWYTYSKWMARKKMIPANFRVLRNCFDASIWRQIGQPSPIHLWLRLAAIRFEVKMTVRNIQSANSISRVFLFILSSILLPL